MRQLIKKILREESDKSLSDERLQKLVGDYISTSYPTAIKVRVAPPGGNIELTLLTLPNPEDEKDNLIFKMDAYGMPDYKINPEFFDSVRSMFGGQNKIKRVIFDWFDEKEVDNDLSIDSKKEEPIEEGLHDTSWENDKGDKVTLIDLLDATEDIPVKNIPVEKIKSKLSTWDDDDKEVAKIEKADLQYPILIFVDDDGKFISIIDGHHRAQKAVKHELKTIKAKIIPINSLPKNFKKVFGHLDKQEQSESKETNRKDLDFFDLVDKGIIFITEPFGNGKKQKSNWEGDSNIITLWNLKHPEKGQEWVFDAIKYPKPEAIQWWNDEGQYTLKDEKYNQILRSIKIYDTSNKQEEKEGAGEYDAPAFEMEPAHTTFKHEDKEIAEYSRTLKNARQQGVTLRFPKSAIKSNPLRFRHYNK